MSAVEKVSTQRFARRPAIGVTPTSVVVAWDALMNRAATGDLDPDYDIFLAHRSLRPRQRAWQSMVVDGGPGIQAAPSVALGADARWWVTYHSTSDSGGLLKHWALRKIAGNGKVSAFEHDHLKRWSLLPEKKDASESQGAEFPVAIWVPDACVKSTQVCAARQGRLAIVSRPSQGAWVHFVQPDGGLSDSLDITRAAHGSAWGARGIKSDVATWKNTLLIARRGRQDIVLERLTFSPAPTLPKGVWKNVDEIKKLNPAKAITSASAAESERPLTYKGMRVMLGDVHMHSALSDGTGAPDEIYARAWVRGLDFAALTDHDYIMGSRMTLSEHDEIGWLTDYFNALPGFTTLHAYEWTTPALPRGAGHKNVYFKDHAPTPVYGFKDGYADTAALQRALKSEHAFTAPHHTGWTGTDWDHADDTIQRHFEIVSIHGEFERAEVSNDAYPLLHRKPAKGVIATYAQDGLRRGHRFGFLGGSDAHGLIWHHGIAKKKNPWEHGLTGVLVQDGENLRAQLWDAMFKRRTFATSGHRSVLVLSSEEGIMGAEVPLQKTSVRLSIDVLRGSGILSVFRDGYLIYEKESSPGTLRLVDEVPAKTAPSDHYYYARLCDLSDCVWTSPVFYVYSQRQRSGVPVRH